MQKRGRKTGNFPVTEKKTGSLNHQEIEIPAAMLPVFR